MGENRNVVAMILDTPDERAALWRSILRSPILDMLRRGDQSSARALFDRLLDEAESAQT